MPLPIAETWFETRTYSDDITLIYEPHVIPDIRCNMWHVRGRDHDLLFDSGMGLISLKRHVALVTEKPLLCVASHSHFDHVGGNYTSPIPGVRMTCAFTALIAQAFTAPSPPAAIDRIARPQWVERAN